MYCYCIMQLKNYKRTLDIMKCTETSEKDRELRLLIVAVIALMFQMSSFFRFIFCTSIWVVHNIHRNVFLSITGGIKTVKSEWFSITLKICNLWCHGSSPGRLHYRCLVLPTVARVKNISDSLTFFSRHMLSWRSWNLRSFSFVS